MAIKTNRPTFLTTKGERNKTACFQSPGIIMHYRDMARAMFDWKGLEDVEDMPYGFIEGEALFFYQGFAIKKVKGWGLCGMGVNASTLDIYGNPYKWLPEIYGQTISGNQTVGSSDLFSESDAPVLYNHYSVYDRIHPYIQIMTRALNTLNVNLAALNHPVLVAGVAGNSGDNVGAIMLKNALDDGEAYVPIVKPDAVGLTAVDLGVTDNTQNMLSIVDWCDSRIKGIMGIGTGVEKASGIGAFDEKGTSAMATYNDSALELRRAWCDRVNDKFGLNITVERNEHIEKVIDDEDMGNDTGLDSESGDTDRDAD
jgi:hypothetical protein